MAKIYLIFLLLLFVIGFGCKSDSEQTAQITSLDFFKSGPQLVKIPITDAAVADSLIKLNIDVVVIEEDYVIARLGGLEASNVQSMSLKMETIKETELMQRLIKIIMKNEYDLRELSDTGIDIWEVKGDTITAQAYDKYIRQIQAKGYSVEIVEKDVQNIIKKHNQK